MGAAGRLIVGVTIAGVAIIAAAEPARALPSFARQTGQPCGRCHTDFPGLTPFGRQFKLGGYTLGGGDYRTTIFPTADEASSTKAVMNYLATKAPPANTGTSTEAPKLWVPPISAMEIIGFTHTQAPQDPTGSPWDPNNNTAVSPSSFFWGGAFTEHTGAFMQLTYNASPMGAPADVFGNKHWTWDNTDIRYANTGKLGSLDVTYGITANNNPTVQDLWNTTPAWGFPYAASTLAPGPAAKTVLDGTFAAHVGGVGAYALINNLLYLELTGYQTVGFNTQLHLGTSPLAAPGMFSNVAPYWRVALEPNWGDHYLMVGTFGMVSQVRPWMDSSGMTSLSTFAQSDRFTDIGFDSQYQYKGENYWLTLRGSYIHEDQKLDASSVNFGTNPTNKLNTAKAYASLAYGDDNRIIFTGQYFNTWGTFDPVQFGGSLGTGSPNSNGYIAEIAYIPYGSSKPPIWPWANARLGVQYTWYNKFDGDKLNAHNNNTVFVYLWMAQ
jgi:hypothetical protein